MRYLMGILVGSLLLPSLASAVPVLSFTLHVDYPTGGTPSSVVIADLNRDGRPDLVATNSTANGLSVLLNNSDCTTAAVGNSEVRGGLKLSAYPNPTDRLTSIAFQLPASGPASVDIYDVLGRRLRQWDWTAATRGQHQVEWNGLTDAGLPVAPGILFYRLTAAGTSLTQKLTWLK
jgi:hypothetical protein